MKMLVNKPKNNYQAKFDQLEMESLYSSFREKQSHLLEELGLPTKKQEQWKYTSLKKVKNEYTISLDNNNADEALDSFDRATLVFKNGVLTNELSTFKNEMGVHVFSLTDLLEKGCANTPFSNEDLHDWLTESSLHKESEESWNYFDALNSAYLLNGSVIYVDKNVDSKKVLRIVHICDKDNVGAVSRNLLVLDSCARVSVLESYLTKNDSKGAFYNTVTDAFVGKNAQLDYVKLQDTNSETVQYHNFRSYLDKDATLNTFAVDFGGQLVRNNLFIMLANEGAFARANGLYLGADKQHIDNTSFIKHVSPRTYSHQLYKGLLADQSSAVFAGRLYIGQDAQQVDSTQLNKTITLSEKAEINTKPQLEVHADDVKAAHGATVGQLDKEELFYLMSRAVSKDQALLMLAQGFASEILYDIPNKELFELVHTYFVNRFMGFISGKDIV